MKKHVAAILTVISIFILFDYTRFENKRQHVAVSIENIITYNSTRGPAVAEPHKARATACPSDSVALTAGFDRQVNPPGIIRVSLFLYIAKFHYICKVQDFSHSLSHFHMFSMLKYIWSFVLLVLIFLV